MRLEDIFELANELDDENKFTKEQWENIVNIMFSTDTLFNGAVEHFYVDMLGFDYDDCENLVTDIQNGNGNAIERFVDDVLYYFNN